jgi:hypothetical protein
MKLNIFDTTPLACDARKHQIVTILVIAINRLTKAEIASFEVDMLFCDGRCYTLPDTYIDDHATICYWTKSNALNYLTSRHIKNHTLTEMKTVLRFQNDTKDIDYCFDAVVLSTQDYQK